MRLFEDEVTSSVATDGPCELLGVEERVEVVGGGYGSAPERRTYGVVVFRAKARMHPVVEDGVWRMPPTAVETPLILLEASLAGAELPPHAGRFLGSFRQGGRRLYAFAMATPRAVARPEGRELPAGAGGSSPARAASPAPAPGAKSPPGERPATNQPNQSSNNAQPGRR